MCKQHYASMLKQKCTETPSPDFPTRVRLMVLHAKIIQNGHSYDHFYFIYHLRYMRLQQHEDLDCLARVFCKTIIQV